MTVAERGQAAPTRSDTEATREVRQFVPDVDIYETDDGLMLLADMPGAAPETLNVQLEKNVLTIQGQAEPVDAAGRSIIHAEYEPGDYYRAFDLSEEIDQEGIEPSFKDGVLTLRLPKAERAKAKKIMVSTDT